jgi:pimeloyl-ACP methyl ester carboxylesterase
MTSFRNKLWIISSIFFSVFLVTTYKTNVAIAATAAVFGGTIADTTLSSDTTYTVDGTVYVNAGTTLTIPAGTHVIAAPGSQIVVYGTVVANGTTKNHITIDNGPLPPAIPFSENAIHIVSTSQSPETPGPDITADDTETPEVQSPAVMSVTMDDEVSSSSGSFGFDFRSGSQGTFSYTDMDGATYGAVVEAGSTVTFSHSTFKDCSIGVLGNEGTLKLTSDTFDTVPTPVSWNVHGVFTHSNTTFINTGIGDWSLGGGEPSDTTIKLNSTDGVYTMPSYVINENYKLTISPGVKLFIQDGSGLEIDGTLSAIGTSEKPITIYGDGICSAHKPAISLIKGSATFEYVNFHDLCSGLSGSQSTLVLKNDNLTTIAGPAVYSENHSTVTADTVIMQDIYHAFDVSSGSTFSLSNATISQVNGDEPAIHVVDESPFTMKSSTVSDAKVCMAISGNSSLTADNITLKDCSTEGILSLPDNSSVQPTGITLTNSSITDSGTALELHKALVLNVSNDVFKGNQVGVSLSDMPATTISNNDWGSVNGPTIADNPGGDGDSIVVSNVPQVTYRPWIGMAEPPEHDPIIIIPGITGSVLTKNYSDKSEIWPNVAEMALSPDDSFLEDLDLLQSGTEDSAKPMLVGDVIRSVGSDDILKSLISTLGNHGYTEGTNLFVLPYDWRLSNTVNQALLKNAIANALQKSGKRKVNIITHSMGGLLAADYLAQNPDAPIDHLFNIAVPHTGAPKAFKVLMYGDDMGYDFSVGSLKIPILNADRVKDISQNMPAVYELLPSQQYIDSNGSYVTDLTQSQSNLDVDGVQSVMVADGRNSAMFPFAKTLHDVTDNLDTSKISAYNFIGCGVTDTVGGFVLSKEQTFLSSGLHLTPMHRLKYVPGDGVVPASSASAGAHVINYYVNSGSHGTMPAVPAIQNTIADILDGNPVTDTGIFSGSGSCNIVPGEIVEVHSPVMLDIMMTRATTLDQLPTVVLS